MKKTNRQTFQPTEKIEINQKQNKFKIFFSSISYAIIPFALFLVSLMLSWGVTQLFGKTTGIQLWTWPDKHIPCVPEFVWVYYLTFPLGIVSYFYLASVDKAKLYDITIVLIISYLISGLFYNFTQTEFPMEVKESYIQNPTTLSELLTVATWNASHPTNCFPSQHCFMAIGVILCCLNTKGIKTWYKWFCYVTGILIIMATVFIKQHFIVDFYGSFVIMVSLYLIVRGLKIGKKIEEKSIRRNVQKSLRK